MRSTEKAKNSIANKALHSDAVNRARERGRSTQMREIVTDIEYAKDSVQRKPNIVYVLTDQWRAQATGYAGDPNVKTPNLDALASQSTNFENAVSVCPICTPHRASLLTGRYPLSTGMFMNDLYLPSDELCMAEVYKQAGYETGFESMTMLTPHTIEVYYIYHGIRV